LNIHPPICYLQRWVQHGRLLPTSHFNVHQKVAKKIKQYKSLNTIKAKLKANIIGTRQKNVQKLTNNKFKAIKKASTTK